MIISKPSPNEYASYYSTYVSIVPDGDIMATLEHQLAEALALFSRITDAQAEFKYAPDKWSIKQLLGHVIDAERVFAFRALWFARGDKNSLAGFDQDAFMSHVNFDAYQWSELVEEFEHLRRSNISFFSHLSPEAWERRGIASDNEVSVRALAFMLAGHELHHLNILRERYLKSA